jgi:hypothetical protein
VTTEQLATAVAVLRELVVPSDKDPA